MLVVELGHFDQLARALCRDADDVRVDKGVVGRFELAGVEVIKRTAHTQRDQCGDQDDPEQRAPVDRRLFRFNVFVVVPPFLVIGFRPAPAGPVICSADGRGRTKLTKRGSMGGRNIVTRGSRAAAGRSRRRSPPDHFAVTRMASVGYRRVAPAAASCIDRAASTFACGRQRRASTMSVSDRSLTGRHSHDGGIEAVAHGNLSRTACQVEIRQLDGRGNRIHARTGAGGSGAAVAAVRRN